MLGAAIVITRPGRPKKKLLTPLPNILSISVRKIQPNVKISFCLGRSVRPLVAFQSPAEILYVLTVHPP
jgi:hypothetical protein